MLVKRLVAFPLLACYSGRVLYSVNPLINIFTPPTLSPPSRPPPLAVNPVKPPGWVIFIPRTPCILFLKRTALQATRVKFKLEVFHFRLSIGLDLSSGTLDLSTFRAEKCTPGRKSTHVFCSVVDTCQKRTKQQDESLCKLIFLYILIILLREVLGFEIP